MKNYEKRVSKDGDLLTLQDRKWFVRRSWEVPEKKLNYWRKRYQTRRLTLSDLADIAMLTDDQIDHTILTDEALCDLDLSDYHGGSRDFLRFYGLLTPVQRAAMDRDGLQLSLLDQNQIDALARAAYWDSNTDKAAWTKRMITCEVDKSGSDYTFCAFDPSGTDEDASEEGDPSSLDEDRPDSLESRSWHVSLYEAEDTSMDDPVDDMPAPPAVSEFGEQPDEVIQ
jgi:hypothetical protein